MKIIQTPKMLTETAVKAPDFGDRRKLLLEDIAILTGGQVFSTEKGMKLDKFSWDWFGQARVVTVGKDETTIVDGKGDADKIKQRIEELQTQIDKSTSPYEKEKLQERLAKFIVCPVPAVFVTHTSTILPYV